MLVKEKIVALRHARGISSAELGEKIGVKQSTICRYEKGYIHNIPYDKLTMMSEVFGCSIEELIGDDPSYVLEGTSQENDNAMVTSDSQEIKLLHWYRGLSLDEKAFFKQMFENHDPRNRVMILTT